MFEIGVDGTAVTLLLRDGFVTDEFIDLARTDDRTDAQEAPPRRAQSTTGATSHGGARGRGLRSCGTNWSSRACSFIRNTRSGAYGSAQSRREDSVDHRTRADDTQAMGLRDMYAKRLQKKWEEKSPEERAEIEAKTAQRYEANMARVAAATDLVDAEWERSRAEHQARLDAEVLGGPAGAHFWGTVPDTVRPSEAGPQPAERPRRLQELLARPQGDRRRPRRSEGAVGHSAASSVPTSIPSSAGRSSMARRAAREAARRPYLAPDRTTPVLTRIATRGDAQFDDLANYLAQSGLAARPDLVFGVYRVPDRLDPKMPGLRVGPGGRVGHRACADPGRSRRPAPPQRVTGSTARPAGWAAARAIRRCSTRIWRWPGWRRRGSIRSQCLGIAREVVMQRADSWFGGGELSSDSADVYARVQGVSVIHTAGAAPPPTGADRGPLRRCRRHARRGAQLGSRRAGRSSTATTRSRRRRRRFPICRRRHRRCSWPTSRSSASGPRIVSVRP